MSRSRLARIAQLAVIALIAAYGAACSYMPMDLKPTPAPAPPPEPEVVRMSVLVTPTNKQVIPTGSRVVVANIGSMDSLNDCSASVKDALMRRLIENANYEVLSRDDLDWIVNEMEQNWSGVFDSRKVEELGRLLGASYFIVGRVAYCGLTSNWAPDSESPVQFSIFATLQIINLKTGRVEVASASEGNFVPRSRQLATLLNLPIEAVEEELADTKTEDNGNLIGNAFQRFMERTVNSGTSSFDIPQAPPAPKDSDKKDDQRSSNANSGPSYQIFRAAEDLANGFADDYFARQVWETVEMWNDETWSHSDALHFVKLGDCPKALRWIEEVAKEETPSMDQKQLGRYMHNYGVVLMCANQPDRAVDKLRSAYRLGYNKTTLRMLGLAQKAQEWALRTEEDEQPEVDELMKNSQLWTGD